jgi:hypothetical protein
MLKTQLFCPINIQLLRSFVIKKNKIKMKKMSKALKCHCYEEKYHFFFKYQKKDRQKIYIIALDIFFILFFFLNYKKGKSWTFVGQKS